MIPCTSILYIALHDRVSGSGLVRILHSVAMEGEGGGGNTAGETMGEARQDAGEMITGSIAVEAFGCHVRAKPLGPPMFEVNQPHHWCLICVCRIIVG
jgi:hypothetical protein